MGSSFQEQLLKLGLVDKKKVDKAKKAQHTSRKKKSRKNIAPPVDENKILAEQALAKKKERARQLNVEREEKLRKREESARIRQMIETTRLEKDDKGVAFRFVDNKKVMRVFVSQQVADQLSSGVAGIVRLAERYEVCPAKTVRAIEEIDKTLVVMLSEKKKSEDGKDEDPYADYEVPDDLVW